MLLSTKAKTVNGAPVISQWARILAMTRIISGYGDKRICSSDPSSISERNILSREILAASTAATQTMAAACCSNTAFCGPSANGNKVTTIRKNNNGFSRSLICRNPSFKSRSRITLNAFVADITGPSPLC